MSGLREFLEEHAISVGENLKYLQKQQNKTNEEIAEEIHCDVRMISRYRNDKTKINNDTAENLARALSVSVDDITSLVIRTQRGLKQKSIAWESEDKMQFEENQEWKRLEQEVLDTLNNTDINSLCLIASCRTSFLQITNYEWEFIHYALQLGDNLASVKDFMLEFEISPKAFINNIHIHNTFLYEIKVALNIKINNFDNKPALIENILESPDKLMNESYVTIQNFLVGIKLIELISEELWDMLILFAQFHDIQYKEPSKKQVRILDYMKSIC